MKTRKAFAAAMAAVLGVAALSGCATRTVYGEDYSYSYASGFDEPSSSGVLGFLFGLVIGGDDDDDDCGCSDRRHGGGGRGHHGGGGGGEHDGGGRFLDRAADRLGLR
jgi:hypothetical protein